MYFKKKINKIYRTSISDVIERLAFYQQNLTKTNKSNRNEIKMPNLEFLSSIRYEELMSMHLPFPGIFDLHEAQNNTLNYRFRHHQALNELGIFRWRGIQKHLNFILKLVTDDNLSIIDFGGAACPIGFNSEVLDKEEYDIYNRKVKYNDFREIPKKVDVVFTSHTLEHISEINDIIIQIKSIIVANGILIVHVPSFYCVDWRAGIHKNSVHSDHKLTFGTSDVTKPNNLVNYYDIDILLSKYFNIELCEYCGDDSIFVICRNTF